MSILFIGFYYKVVSAAPLSSFEPAFEHFANNPLDTGNQNKFLKRLLEGYKCTRDVIGIAIGESHLKSYYEQFKKEFDAVLKDDLAKCHEIHTSKEKYSYVLRIVNFKPFDILDTSYWYDIYEESSPV